MTLARNPSALRKDGWFNRFLGDDEHDHSVGGLSGLYPNATGAGHGFSNGGQAGSVLDQVVLCSRSSVPLDANLVVLDFSVNGGGGRGLHSSTFQLNLSRF